MNKQVLISFSIGKYDDEVLCDVVPMQVGHLLLGRPWKYVKKVKHDGFSNKYSFVHNQLTITLVLLTLSQVYEDQVRLQKESEQKKKSEKDSEQKKESDKKKLIEIFSREKERETEKNEREKKRT